MHTHNVYIIHINIITQWQWEEVFRKYINMKEYKLLPTYKL